MKLSTIQKALNYYRSNRDSSFEVLADIKECMQIRARYDCADIYKDSVYIITEDALFDFLNMITYDTLGRSLKKLGNAMTFQRYADECRSFEGLFMHTLTDAQLRLGYDTLTDLWRDNEEQDCHNPDGSFRKAAQFSKEELDALVNMCVACIDQFDTSGGDIDYSQHGVKTMNEILKVVREWYYNA